MKDLREFLDLLESKGELKRVRVSVSKDLEITEITNRACKSDPQFNKALLFENVEGYKIPILTNLFGSERRMALCFGLNSLSELSEKVKDLLNFDLKGSVFDLLNTGYEFFKRIKEATSLKTVNNAPCQEVLFVEDEVDLRILPIPKFWPQDGGPYLTLPQLITHNPLTKKRNVGMYRLQLIDEKRLLVHWQTHKNGREHEDIARSLGIRKIPCAVALGGDPLCIWVAVLPLPIDLDEYMLVSFWRREAVRLVKCKTQPIYVPAFSEIVIEGYVDIEDRRMEGPFGDHTGYYTPQAPYPVLNVTAITMRKNPILPATVTGIPPMEDYWMGKAVERFFLPFLKLLIPEINDINMPSFGVFHNLLLVSIKKRYPGQAKKVISALWGLGMLALTKAIVVLDEDVDLKNMDEVFWHIFGSVDWIRDVILMEGPIDELDHASSKALYGGKIGIDATRKFKEEGYTRTWPEIVRMDPEIVKRVDEKWKAITSL
ncbi:MAG: menaquinone biosynthesis decarboxylase [Desulfobacterota bacterium]|nr:menaquinone biosynthesis decarboxylase [Thermodesulfobacteriota bacterium]MDW8002324.1 menaquinone biosynthesis decarboxylase [Deltaproteobacteria bacterium]